MKSTQHEAVKSETAAREEEVLAFWKEHGTFEKSLNKEAPNGEFVFYDGPPFATGLPHWGSLLSSISKDVVGRYKTMRGYRVPRRWGWDCHGLPIENMIEKELDLKSKKDIEALGIDVFNEKARAGVLKYADDWKTYVDRVGRWVDFDNSYKTMDNSYIESVWWVLSKINADGRLYEGRKVLMYCPRCETPLSKAEIAMDNSYKDVTDTAVYVKFRVASSESRVASDGPVYVLAWTTTPWTLPANVALAVGEQLTYVRVRHGDDMLILAKERLSVLGDEVEVLEEMPGADLVGISYEPLYEVERVQVAGSKRLHTIQAAGFVTTEEGTGVVHIAPMYGEDDYQLGKEHELPMVPLLDVTGTYNNDAPELVRGMYFKKGGKAVVADLEERGLLLASHDHTHSYPHCYRCGAALIYNALTSWFIDIQAVKDELLAGNEKISWHPEHLKYGRFKNIVETAPDWTISRNRFWASPLPIWHNRETGEYTVIGSLAELRERTKKSGNTYLVMRHGQAESNVKQVISSLPDDENHLTDAGKEQVRAAALALKERGITKIIASPFVRTRETAALVASALGLPAEDIVHEPRIGEWQLGDLHGKPVADLKKTCATYDDRFRTGCGTGETLLDFKRRVGEALYDIERTYADETILIVGHEYTAWLLQCVARGANTEESIVIRGEEDDYIANAEVRELDFVPLPHNKEYELDLHRPYIDELELVAEDGAHLVRIPEVVDCWVESGAMPYASEHYPMEHKEVMERRFPGDFIAEYIAQTRTWFYYMHALGVLLFGGSSFTNVVTTGNVLAADGAKMSKSKKNYTDPLADMDRYGADAARYYLLGSVVMSAEDMSFKEEELREAHNRYVNMLWNSYKFFELHRDACEAGMQRPQSTYVLDRWMLARLNQAVREVTEQMDAYDTVRTARALRELVTDLSTWYVRRSRDRFKSDDDEDRYAAHATLQHVLVTVAKLTAPLTPFIAESIYRGVRGENESVHLSDWPAVAPDVDDEGLLNDMTEVRCVASLALEARQRAKVKVRQPLAKLTLKEETLVGKDELLAILADEINVKQVVFGSGFDGSVHLDTNLTDDLRQEGAMRDLVRAVQQERKRRGCVPEEIVTLEVETDEVGRGIVESGREELTRVAGVGAIVFGTVTDGFGVRAGDMVHYVCKVVQQS